MGNLTTSNFSNKSNLLLTNMDNILGIYNADRSGEIPKCGRLIEV